MRPVNHHPRTIHRLCHLKDCDSKAAALFSGALAQTENLKHREKFEEFRCAHERQARDLAGAIEELAGSADVNAPAADTPSCDLRNCAGQRELLQVLAKSTSHTTEQYESVLDSDYPETVDAVIQNGFLDVLRHQAWLESRLHPLPLSTLLFVPWPLTLLPGIKDG